MASAGLLAGGMGETGDRGIPHGASLGRVSEFNVHDVGSRYCCCESEQRLPGVEGGRASPALEPQGIKERDGFSTAITSP